MTIRQTAETIRFNLEGTALNGFASKCGAEVAIADGDTIIYQDFFGEVSTFAKGREAEVTAILEEVCNLVEIVYGA
jgi:hypothetical protein